MAVIHENHSELRKKKNKFKWLSLLAMFSAIFFAFLAVADLPLMGLVGAISFLSFMFLVNHYTRLRVGVKGEDRALKLLKKLPDDYEVYPSLQLSGKEGNAELDYVIIGNNGVFVVEVKNHNGTITGNEDDRSWIQHKVGKRGGQYSSKMRNPVKQVRRQVYLLSSYLKENNCGVWIEGAVLFTNVMANVNVHTEKTPVYSTSSGIQDFVTTYQPRKEIRDQELKRVNQIVSGLLQ